MLRGRYVSFAVGLTDANDGTLPAPRGILVRLLKHRAPCSSALNLCEPEYPATGPHSHFAMESYIQVHGVGHALVCVARTEFQPPRLPRPQYIASLPQMFSSCSPNLMDLSHHCHLPHLHVVHTPS
jgi:hypothetical protein